MKKINPPLNVPFNRDGVWYKKIIVDCKKNSHFECEELCAAKPRTKTCKKLECTMELNDLDDDKTVIFIRCTPEGVPVDFQFIINDFVKDENSDYVLKTLSEFNLLTEYRRELYFKMKKMKECGMNTDNFYKSVNRFMEHRSYQMLIAMTTAWNESRKGYSWWRDAYDTLCIRKRNE